MSQAKGVGIAGIYHYLSTGELGSLNEVLDVKRYAAWALIAVVAVFAAGMFFVSRKGVYRPSNPALLSATRPARRCRGWAYQTADLVWHSTSCVRTGTSASDAEVPTSRRRLVTSRSGFCLPNSRPGMETELQWISEIDGLDISTILD
jgi:hypothetical protein